ncbi:MAG: hypothetical protein GQ565_13840 [Candidatus Aegiribacteria sp.]|nr:hypothetical protein [Candidatus Aegiribacteria sp.]
MRQNQVPYMVWWVKHYLSIGQPGEAMYADILEKEGRKDWQIRQALEAVKIYCSMYLGDSEEAAVTGLAPLDDLTSVLHGIDEKEIANELWHQVFGNINEYLVREGILLTPEHKIGEGRYFQALYIRE